MYRRSRLLASASSLAFVLGGCVSISPPAAAWPVVPGMYGGVAAASALPVVYSSSGSCAVPPAVQPGTQRYVDPVGGNDSNPGTIGSRWLTMAHARDTASAGDTINLYSGAYGDVNLDGKKFASFVLVQPVAGQTPVFSTLSMVGSQYWKITGVKIQSLSGGTNTPLVNISGSAGNLSQNIVIDANNISSIDDSSAWTTAADWTNNARVYAVFIDSALMVAPYTSVVGSDCIAITNNTIKNVASADGTVINIAGEHILVAGNTTDRFAADYVDYGGNHVLIARNTARNSLYLANGHHNDFAQGSIEQCPVSPVKIICTFDDVIIDGNDFRDRTVSAASLGALFDANNNATQGIGDFDMNWSNFQVINNIVVTGATDGLNGYSILGGLIANNTLLGNDLSLGGPALIVWLQAGNGNTTPGANSNNVIVRNNIAQHYQSDCTSCATVDHNLFGTKIEWPGLATTTPGTYGTANVIDSNGLSTTFVTLNKTSGTYDFHLAGGSPAIAAGTTPAPNHPDGTTRAAPVDEGAY